jgi:hypothetical protein
LSVTRLSGTAVDCPGDSPVLMSVVFSATFSFTYAGESSGLWAYSLSAQGRVVENGTIIPGEPREVQWVGRGAAGGDAHVTVTIRKMTFNGASGRGHARMSWPPCDCGPNLQWDPVRRTCLPCIDPQQYWNPETKQCECNPDGIVLDSCCEGGQIRWTLADGNCGTRFEWAGPGSCDEEWTQCP